MQFIKGRQKTGGRRPGAGNKLTREFREAVRLAYDGIGGHLAFQKWAKKHPGDFYKIAARLIPVEHRKDDEDRTVTIVIQKLAPQPQPVVNPPLPVAGTLVDHSHDQGEGHAHG